MTKQLVIGDLSLTSDTQKEFFRTKTKYVMFGGARGGGKSWAVRAKAKMLALRYPGIKILLVRRTYLELLNNHIDILVGELTDIATYNKTEKIFRFRNGSTLKAGYCNTDSDLMQYQGAEYDIIFLDEATNLREEWIKKIIACLRGTNNFPKRVYYTCNPGGVSHGYFKRLFLDRQFEEGEDPNDYVFIRSLVTDNKALMASQPDYIKQLEALPPKLREMWLYGSWDLGGDFFEDFVINPSPLKAQECGCTVDELRKQRRWCHVIEPFDLSKGECRNWTIMRSYDFGYNKPFSLGYWAMDYDGTLYRIYDFYGGTKTPNEGVRWSPDEQFKRIADFEHNHPWFKGRKIVDSVADPSIWDTSRGESIAETAMRYGIYFSPGDNNRIPGWMQVHYRFQFDANGYPRMYVFNTCATFIRTIPLMVYSETHPEDLDTELEDHLADEVRYMCMSRPIKPILPTEEKIILTDPLNQFSYSNKRKY